MNLKDRAFLRLYPLLYWHSFNLFNHHKLNAKYHSIYLHYLEKNFPEIIHKYQRLTPPPATPIPPDAPIWVMWLQGEQHMPPIVKACYNNLKKHAGQHPIILLTHHNLTDYLKASPLWDDHITRLAQQKTITLTKMSNYARLCILHAHGGIWVDATLWLNQPINQLTHGLSFLSGRANTNNNIEVAEGKWTTFFIGCNKGNPLMSFIYEILLAHLRREHRYIHYFMFDYAFVVAYNHLPYVRDMIAPLPIMPDKFHTLRPMLSQPLSLPYLNSLRAEVPFFKLTYHADLRPTTPDGQPTYYGWFISQH